MYVRTENWICKMQLVKNIVLLLLLNNEEMDKQVGL